MTRFSLADLRGDRAAMDRILAWSRGKTGIESHMVAAEAAVQLSCGHLARARELETRRRLLVSGDGSGDDTVNLLSRRLDEIELGLVATPASGIAELTKKALDLPARTLAALTLARNGSTKEALALAEALERENPKATLLRNNALPVIRAAAALARGNADEAIEALEITSGYELATADGLGMRIYPAYYRGLALLKKGRGAEAAVELKKIADRPGALGADPFYPLARLQLARAYAMAGDGARSRAEYDAILDIWKDADRDFAPANAARAERAGL
jgi:hypothetical protein